MTIQCMNPCSSTIFLIVGSDTSRFSMVIKR